MTIITSLNSLLVNPIWALGIPLVIGATGGAVKTQSAWFNSLRQPPLYPPRWAFPVAWMSLYALMGYSSHILALAAHPGRAPLGGGSAIASAPAKSSPVGDSEKALGWYWASLGLNALWMPLFFTARSPLLALVDVLALGASIAKTYEYGRRVDSRVGGVMIGYFGWVAFATYLNGAMVLMNRRKLGLA